jgi:GDP-D-mannose dehydratase
MWMMLQQDEPGDYVLATGRAHTVQHFADLAFAYVGLNYLDYVVQDPMFIRPAEVDFLVGNPSKANNFGLESKHNLRRTSGDYGRSRAYVNQIMNENNYIVTDIKTIR